ncbi:hypothetical protein DL239_03865 [Sedimentitalea sp. CY04]|uniref:Lipoprotein n=1 Tax=Parasedimentitalea denitrificans TaxID=2211118 RepID=A0ABX0W3U9_9RHOB|nr:hypothetical protein [Sedimentitalea sp. CY04]NIZ60111.1 hypothetical protein [Sedimentitalea sp. CY04]
MSKLYKRISLLPAIVGLALTALAGCAMDSEDEVRARVGDWVSLGDTTYFKSTMDCTAGVFKVDGVRVTSLISKARSIATGMTLLKEGDAVAFDVKGLSPNAVSEQIMTRDLPQGIGVLSSGIAGKNCMTDQIKEAYLRALLDPDSVLMFDPDGNVMAVLDRRNSKIYYARGTV